MGRPRASEDAGSTVPHPPLPQPVLLYVCDQRTAGSDKSCHDVVMTNPLALQFAAWLGCLRSRGHSPKTIALYRTGVESLLRHTRIRCISDLTADILLSWRRALASRDLSDSTVDIYLRAIRAWLAWLEGCGARLPNRFDSLARPKYARRLLPAPSVREIRRWLAVPNPSTPLGIRDRALLELAYGTGARREELWSLEMTALDFAQATVRVVGKGRRERVLPLTRAAISCLRRYTKVARPALVAGHTDSGVLWVAQDGKRLGYAGVKRVFDRHARAAGLKAVSPHAMRRACATHLLQRGAHPLFVQEILGHTTTRHLGHYLRATIMDLKATHARSKPGR